jgi:hypothetical protein
MLLESGALPQISNHWQLDAMVHLFLPFNRNVRVYLLTQFPFPWNHICHKLCYSGAGFVRSLPVDRFSRMYFAKQWWVFSFERFCDK